MTSVWIVIVDEVVDAIFSTEDKAKAYANKLETELEVAVEEWAIDAPDREI